MNMSTGSFRDFEHAGWSDGGICRNYDEHFGSVTMQSIPAMLDAAGVGEGSRVLDVCTGAGYAAGMAAERGARALGVDFSATQVELARQRHPKARFQEGDGAALPFADENFDCVVNSIGIPHFADPDAAIRESFRVLKSRGKFAFTVYASPDRAVGFGAVYGAVRAHGTMDIGLPTGPNFFLFSDPAESESRLAAAGFVSVSVTTVPQTWRPSTPDDAIDALLHGSVRAAATLQGQSPKAWPKIRAAIWEALESHKCGDKYGIPMPAVLVSATKP